MVPVTNELNSILQGRFPPEEEKQISRARSDIRLLIEQGYNKCLTECYSGQEVKISNFRLLMRYRLTAPEDIELHSL